ncbi:MAG: ABC transporter ATP-binding protein [Deltaproteobacteria bacterium]|nr:ABC transporter ATP-binding protein [Deltaproteobacteria bacterium]
MIQISGLKKYFRTRDGRVEALRGIDLEVAEGEFCVLLGPSGCGKTTTLRCVAGLERADAGEIRISGAVVSSSARGVQVPAEKRDIGMVFQSYAIWPHMNVFQNVAFPLIRGRRQVPRRLVAEKVRRALSLVQLEHMESRPATDLSGGQQQRVAMARAVVTEPQILLMDEPLSNLDARLREQMRLELKKITSSVGVTTLYVTHDQAEALSLGDKVCVMHEGEILQIGTPREVYARPDNLFVAQFVGEMNFVPGRVTGAGQVDSPLGQVRCHVPPRCEPGSELTLAIRPERLTLKHELNDGSDGVKGTVISKNYVGDAALFEVQVRDVILRIKLPGDSDFAIGNQVAVVVPADHWRVYTGS